MFLFHTPPEGAHCTQEKHQSRDLNQLTEQLECLGFAVNPALNLEMLAAELFSFFNFNFFSILFLVTHQLSGWCHLFR